MSQQEFMDLTGVVPVEVRVKGPDGKEYVLKEATGEAAARFQNARLKAAKFSPDGKALSVEGIGELEAYLVSLCLFDDKGFSVNVATIKAWPNRLVKRLFEKAYEISDLSETTDQPIIKAFSHPSSPLSVEDLRRFASELPDEHRAFKLMVRDPKAS